MLSDIKNGQLHQPTDSGQRFSNVADVNSRYTAHKREFDACAELILCFGLNKTTANKLNGHMLNQFKNFRVDFPKSVVRATGGWFDNNNVGQLAGTLAYKLYVRNNPKNRGIIKPPTASELLSTIKGFFLLYPQLTHDHDKKNGLNAIRLYSLLEDVSFNSVVEEECTKCDSMFLKIDTKDVTTCPACALASRHNLGAKTKLVSNGG